MNKHTHIKYPQQTLIFYDTCTDYIHGISEQFDRQPYVIIIKERFLIRNTKENRFFARKLTRFCLTAADTVEMQLESDKRKNNKWVSEFQLEMLVQLGMRFSNN